MTFQVASQQSMKQIILFIALLFFSAKGISQTAPDKYWIRFTDKNNSSFSLNNPYAFLSEKCIERRNQFEIGFDQKDIPVNQHYINEVLNIGSCTLHNKSKWFNAITISVSNVAIIESILALPFVAEVRSVQVLQNEMSHQEKIQKHVLIDNQEWNNSQTECDSDNNFGPSFRQIEMLNGHLLHELGYTGKGIDIAQLDAGWAMTDKLPAFDALRGEDRLIMTRDFVFTNENNVYHTNTHGTYVLSLMTGNIEDSLIGTAPGANYFLFRTEYSATETLVEEDNWVAAAELCDSLGVDIINSSLGYSLFDSTYMNHSYADMDGNTTRCSIAADIAAQKGILVVNSAGNSGSNNWHYITAPSDGDSVLCVGAVDANGHHAFFSSYGPSSDGDVKPNVSAMGFRCVFAALDSTISTGNGTSFSSPITAGMAACLWQAFPNKSNMDILRAIEQSAHTFENPTDSLGYGIPDFWKAFLILQGNTQPQQGDLNATIFPNPCSTYLNVILEKVNTCDTEYEIYSVEGKRVFEGKKIVDSKSFGVLKLDEAISNLADATYLLHLKANGKHSLIRFEIDKK